ncbi:MAG: hypothetical protein HYZ53_01030 [Planctomycetes bacterium]|nr:hypothetical protein [Planctomycetota bacterium]
MLLVLLGLLGVVVLARLSWWEKDGRRTEALVALASVRTSIQLYFARTAMPPPVGMGRAMFPTLNELVGRGGGRARVLEHALPLNPYSSNPDFPARNEVLKIDLPPTGARRRPSGTTGAWAYDDDRVQGKPGEPYPPGTPGYDVGTFWANTSTPGVDEFLF